MEQKQCQRLGKAVIIDEASVDRENAHQQNDVPAAEYSAEHLGARRKRPMKHNLCSSSCDNVIQNILAPSSLATFTPIWVRQVEVKTKIQC